MNQYSRVDNNSFLQQSGCLGWGGRGHSSGLGGRGGLCIALVCAGVLSNWYLLKVTHAKLTVEL